jgi:integrase
MRRSDYQKLCKLGAYLYGGGLPTLGKPHPKAGYRWCIGYADYGGGKVQPWRENLGRDKLVAQHRAREMTDLWWTHVEDQIAYAGFPDVEQVVIPPLNRDAARKEAWGEADAGLIAPARFAEKINEKLKGHAGQLGPALSPGLKLVVVREAAADGEVAALPPVEPPAQSVALKLHRAGDRWLLNLRKRLEAGDIREDYVHRAERTIRYLKKLAEDLPVDDIAKGELDTIRLAFQSKRTKRGKLRSRGTIDTELGIIHTFFQWLSDSELWEPCRNWERWLRPIHRSDENDDDADNEKTIVTYELDELVRIYAVAPESLRLWMLCGLNFAWGSTELSTARTRHFKRDADVPRVARYRHKRRPGAQPVPGRWLVWPETWALALARMERTPTDPAINPKGYAFLTRDRQKLVRYQTSENGKERRYDVPAEALEAVCKKIGVRYRGFYAIRRTAIDMMEQIAGKRVADLFCQHRPKDMTEKHYLNKRWRKLFVALLKLREQLQPMFAGSC